MPIINNLTSFHIVTVSSYNSSTETSKLQSLGDNKYKVLEDNTLIYTDKDQDISFSKSEE